MATDYSDIYDLFLQRVKDWKLDALYTSDPTTFETYLEGFLVLSVPLFYESDQSLARDDTLKQFTEDLSDANKEILSMLMVLKWFEKETQNITQFTMALQDKDFKRYAEANNLKSKEEWMIFIEEQKDQRILEYSWNNSSSWDDLITIVGS